MKSFSIWRVYLGIVADILQSKSLSSALEALCTALVESTSLLTCL